MITMRTMKQIPTCRMVRGFRSGGGSKLRHVEQRRIGEGQRQMMQHEERRQWLAMIWQERQVEGRA